jgi:hypothetical protein
LKAQDESLDEKNNEDIGDLKQQEPEMPNIELKTLPKGLKYEFLGADKIQSRTLISGIGFTPPPLGPALTLIVVSIFAAISPAHVRIQLRHRFAFWFSSIPGARGRPLLGSSPALIIFSVSTPPLAFFQGKYCAYPFRKKNGAVETFILHPLTFTNHI